MKYLFIFIGGSIGTLLRWQISSITTIYHLPLGTLLANLIGAFFMGYLTVLFKRKLHAHPQIKQGVTTGLLGALTTFSTFQLELVTLAHQMLWLPLIIYSLISYLGGLFCCFLGWRLGGEQG